MHLFAVLLPRPLQIIYRLSSNIIYMTCIRHVTYKSHHSIPQTQQKGSQGQYQVMSVSVPTYAMPCLCLSQCSCRLLCLDKCTRATLPQGTQSQQLQGTGCTSMLPCCLPSPGVI